MTIQTKTYDRKPLQVEAVRVTKQNMSEVALWCGGTIKPAYNDRGDFIKIDMEKPLTARQTTAFIGDWVLKTESTVRVFTHRAFSEGFDPAPKKEIVYDNNCAPSTDTGVILTAVQLRDMGVKPETLGALFGLGRIVRPEDLVE